MLYIESKAIEQRLNKCNDTNKNNNSTEYKMKHCHKSSFSYSHNSLGIVHRVYGISFGQL